MTQKFSSDKPSIDEIKRLKQPARRTVEIPMDSTVTQKISAKEAELGELSDKLQAVKRRSVSEVGKSLADGSKTVEIEKQMEAIEGEIDVLWEEAGDVIASFTFQDLGRKKYDDLVQQHPPTADQKKEWEDNGGEGVLAYNTDTFPPALMAATAIEPTMTVDDATDIYENWGNFEVIKLFNAAQSVCLGDITTPKSRRSQNVTVETPVSN